MKHLNVARYVDVSTHVFFQIIAQFHTVLYTHMYTKLKQHNKNSKSSLS